MAVVSRGIAVPCFREDPAELIELGVEAERAGFDGFFPWDHLVWCHRGQDHAVALCDPAGHSRPLACGRMADLWRARRQKRRPQRRAGVGRRSGDRPDDRWRSAAPGSPDGRGVPSASKSRIVTVCGVVASSESPVMPPCGSPVWSWWCPVTRAGRVRHRRGWECDQVRSSAHRAGHSVTVGGPLGDFVAIAAQLHRAAHGHHHGAAAKARMHVRYRPTNRHSALTIAKQQHEKRAHLPQVAP